MAVSDGAGGFPPTRYTLLEQLESDDVVARGAALDTLFEAYWQPVYKYLRLRWAQSREDAADTTQGFFAAVVEKRYFDRYDPQRAKFRTFLRTCLDAYVANAQAAAGRLKRGGHVHHVHLDLHAAESELAVTSPISDPDELFHREWLRSVFAGALRALERECERSGRALYFTLFREYELAAVERGTPRTYGELAAEYGIAVHDVANHLAWCRRAFRRLVADRVRVSAGAPALGADDVLALLRSRS